MSNPISKRQCRKCGNKIPVKIKIDGKSKNLKNRKFCLDCSPYLGGNRNQYDPDCSTRESKEHKKKRNKRYALTLYKRALERKHELIALSGGACKNCGYNKNISCLSFHHIDSSTKCFGLSLNYLWSNSWKAILEEHSKCELLCLNCHGEIESEKSDIVKRVNEKYGTNF